MRNRNSDRALRANGFVTAVLSILMFILVSIFILLLAVRTITAASVIQNTDIAWVLEETGVSNQIVDQINDLPFVETNIDVRDVDEFIRNDVVSREISRVMGGYLDALAQGNLDHHITQDDILRIARNVEPELNEMFGHEMTEVDHERLSRALDEAVDLGSLSIGNFVEEAGIDIDLAIPQLAVSLNVLILVGALCIVTFLLMVLHHRRLISDSLSNAGFPMILSGLLCFVNGFILQSYAQMFGPTFYRISSAILGGPISLIMTYGLYAAGLGIVLIITRLIIRATRPRVAPRHAISR